MDISNIQTVIAIRWTGFTKSIMDLMYWVKSELKVNANHLPSNAGTPYF